MRLLIIMLPTMLVGSFLIGYKFSQYETEEKYLVAESQLFDKIDCEANQATEDLCEDILSLQRALK